MVSLIKYIANTLFKELAEDLLITKDIVVHHASKVKQVYQFKKQKRRIRNSMSKAQTYEEWAKYAEEFDNLSEVKTWK
jgi:hypothetical protein